MMVLGMLALIFFSNSAVSAEDKKLDLERCAPGQDFTVEIDNPYILYFPVGRQWRLVGEEDDEQVIVRITVLDATEEVAGVTTRVVEELEAVDENEDGVIQNEEVIEQSFNYYAQPADGTVCYFGEAVFEPSEEEAVALAPLENGDEPEPGVVVPGLEETDEGAWRADEPGNTPGIFFPSDPKEGTRFQQENGPPDALDEMRIVGSGPVRLEEVTIAGVEMEEVTFADVVRGREFNPVDGDKGYKRFARGVGIIIDEDFQLKETVLP
jgi:hypothetical protein